MAKDFERGKDPKQALKIGLYKKVFDSTSRDWSEGGAYSFSNYGEENWMDIIEWMASEGYTPGEVEQVLRSKLMRWASDMANAKGKVTLEDFKKYNTYYMENRGKKTTEIDDLLNEFGEWVNEEMGGTSAPMGNLTNTPGMGNAQPAKTSAMTGSQQASDSATGSGDKFDSSIGPMHTQAKTVSEKLAEDELDEENINPHDKLGTAMAKKMGVPMTFEKGKGDQDVKQKKVNEMNISPHDKLGVAMAKKMGIEIPFVKGEGDKDVRQKVIDIDPDLSSEVMSFEEWEKKFLNEGIDADLLRYK